MFWWFWSFEKGHKLYCDKICKTAYFYKPNYKYRANPILVKVVEELGKEASDKYSNLKVIDIPDNTDYIIDECNGVETLCVNSQSY